MSRTTRQRITLRTEGQGPPPLPSWARPSSPPSEGTPVRLKDVASVREGPEPKFGDAAIYVAADDEARPKDADMGVLLVVNQAVRQ